MSPCFMAATARSATSPMQSSTNVTGRLRMRATSAATGLSEFFDVAALRAAEMREQDHLAALGGDLGDRRRHALDARGVGDHAVVDRHVEVDAHQHAFAFDVDVVERVESAHEPAPGALERYSSLPIATAVSDMRLEKPHSLSYQDITRTSVPSITLVWSMWKIEECGSWLKSIETLGASV